MTKFAVVLLMSAFTAGCVLQLPAPSAQAPAQLSPTPVSQPDPPKQPELGDSDGGWVYVTTIDQNVYQMQEGSFRFDGDTKGNTLAVVVTRVINNRTRDITLFQWSVPTDDCIAGRGALVAHDMQGNLSGQNGFVFGGGNIASLVAETICGAAVKAAQRTNPQQPKKAETSKDISI
jgi:hypothetical protein